MKNYVETENLKQQLRMEAALGYVKTLEDVEKIIDFCVTPDQPSADQWIPCSRELPPLDEEVLIHCEKDHYNVAYFDGGDFRAFDCLYDAEDVVAWKEFERYKGE